MATVDPVAPPVAPPIALIVVDDNPLLREGLAAVLGAEPGFKVLAAAADGNAACEMVRQAKPDVVLVDLGLADHDSLSLTARVHGEVPTAKVIVMGLLPAQADVTEFVRAGASGFIMKDASLDDFRATIRAVAEGKEVLPQALTNTVFAQVARMAKLGPRTDSIDAMRLTAHESQIIALIGEGRTKQEIATQLGITTQVLRSEVHNAMEKLALHHQLDAGPPGDTPPGE